MINNKEQRTGSGPEKLEAPLLGWARGSEAEGGVMSVIRGWGYACRFGGGIMSESGGGVFQTNKN